MEERKHKHIFLSCSGSTGRTVWSGGPVCHGCTKPCEAASGRFVDAVCVCGNSLFFGI